MYLSFQIFKFLKFCLNCYDDFYTFLVISIFRKKKKTEICSIVLQKKSVAFFNLSNENLAFKNATCKVASKQTCNLIICFRNTIINSILRQIKIVTYKMRKFIFATLKYVGNVYIQAKQFLIKNLNIKWSGASVAHTPSVREVRSHTQTQDGIFGSSHLPSFRQQT